MGAARKLKSEMAKSKDKKAVAKAPDYFKKSKIKTEKKLYAVYHFFRSARKCFHICKGPRKTGNSWWINTGRDNAYKRIGAVVINKILEINTKIVAKISGREIPVKAEPETAKAEANEYKADYEIKCSSVFGMAAYAEEKISVHPVEVHYRNEEKREVRIDNVEIKAGASVIEKHVPGVISVPEIREEKIRVVSVKVEKIEAKEIVKKVDVSKRNTKKEETSAPKGTKPEVRKAEIIMPASRDDIEIKAPASRKNETTVYIEKTSAPVSEFPMPKVQASKQTDVEIKVKPFTFLAASIKAAKMEPEEIRTSGLKISAPVIKPEKQEEDVYSILKGAGLQKLYAQKVASAADSLN